MTEPPQPKADMLHDPERLLKITAYILLLDIVVEFFLFILMVAIAGTLPESTQQSFQVPGFVSILTFAAAISLSIVMIVTIHVYFAFVKSGKEARAKSMGGYIELSKTSKILIIIFLGFVVSLPFWILLNYWM